MSNLNGIVSWSNLHPETKESLILAGHDEFSYEKNRTEALGKRPIRTEGSSAPRFHSRAVRIQNTTASQPRVRISAARRSK